MRYTKITDVELEAQKHLFKLPNVTQLTRGRTECQVIWHPRF